MKAFRSFLSINIGMFIFFFMFISGGLHVSALPQMEMHEHGSGSSSNCQTRCSTGTIAIAALSPDEQKEDDNAEPPSIAISGIQNTPLDDDSVQKVRNSIDARILRPPDIIVLNCIYRI